MVNILMSRYFILEVYKEVLRTYLKSKYNVAVIPFSFRPEVIYDLDSWNQKYGKESACYQELISAFASLDIPEKQIKFINYYTDSLESAKECKLRAVSPACTDF